MSHRLNHGTHRHHSNVNHPDHYQSDKMEVIDIIEAFKLNFHLGNVIKYITRADKKGNSLKDLEKAKWYLQREINNRYKQQDDQPNHDIVSYDKSVERFNRLTAEEEQRAERFREAMQYGDDTGVY